MNTINIIHGDSISAMQSMKDNQYDLAIVDPEYGINMSNKVSYRKGATTTYKKKKWDIKPAAAGYFIELFKVSKNQIIWGGNYFDLPICKKPIVWDKKQPEGIDQAMFEFAWNSQHNKQAKIFRRSPSQDKNCISNGDKRKREQKKRIHPTQKPVALYNWLLKNYAKPGDKIFDSHGGSMSHAIAAIDMGFDLDIYEIDDDYYDAACKRIKNHLNQLDLTRPPVQVLYRAMNEQNKLYID